MVFISIKVRVNMLKISLKGWRQRWQSFKDLIVSTYRYWICLTCTFPVNYALLVWYIYIYIYIVISCDHEYVILVLLFTAHCSSILYWPIGDFPGVAQASFVKVNKLIQFLYWYK